MAAKFEISQVKDVVTTGESVVVKLEARAGEEATDLEIAITTELAPAMAIAMLATTARARAARDGLEPALEVLAAAVVASGSAEKVRMHLLFHAGAVLPIEMPSDAADALNRALAGDITDATPAAKA
jgi:hypothetical protein